MNRSDSFHPGERAVQARTGEAEMALQTGKMLSNEIQQGAMHWLARQSFAAATTVDPRGRVWTTILAGEAGFLEAKDRQTLAVRASTSDADPLFENLRDDPRLGLVVMDLEARRRLRLNGEARLTTDGLLLTVAESYPNCPKFIHRRELLSVEPEPTAPEPTRGQTLTESHRHLIAGADTLFVGSANPEGLLDASHRGGAPGFVEVVNDHTLRVPDYEGNGLYNTLGNIAVNPSAGLAFFDFETSTVLALTGLATLEWSSPLGEARTGGTKRSWTFDVEEWRAYPLPVTLEWQRLDPSPFNPPV